MGQPVKAVYDFGAAETLLLVLARAHDRVSGVTSLRGKQRSAQLGDPNSDKWQGARRARFEKDFGPQQQELGVLGDNLLRLITAVSDANSAAQAYDTAHAKN